MSTVQPTGNLHVSFTADDAELAKDDDLVKKDDGVEVEVATQPSEEATEVEIEAPRGEEDPLEVLRKQFDDIKAQKEEADRRAFEAARVARENEAKLQQHQVAEIGNHKAILEQAYNAEELKIAELQAQICFCSSKWRLRSCCGRSIGDVTLRWRHAPVRYGLSGTRPARKGASAGRPKDE